MVSAIVAPHVPLDPATSNARALASYVIAYASVAMCVVGVAALAPDLGRLAIVIAIVAALALSTLGSSPPSLVRVAIVLACLLAAGTSVGAAIGVRIEHAGHLLPVAIVSSLADAFSVWTPGAPSNAALEAPELLSVLAIGWPMAGTHDLPAILGVGDVAFVALYFGAARKHALALSRTALALFAGLAATALTVAVTSIAIPALPFLGAAVVLAHPEARKLPASDRRTALIGLALVVIAFAALVLSRVSE